MSEVEEVLEKCTNVLPGHGGQGSIKGMLEALAGSLDGTEMADSYGKGMYISDFESETAEMFGKEAAVFMPSGTMAQQIALRIVILPTLLHLVLVKTAHPLSRMFQGFALHRVDVIQCRRLPVFTNL